MTKKIGIQVRHNFGYVGSSGGVVSHENCDSIIARIKQVYSLYGERMSLEDKKHLLAMLSQIEKSKKCIGVSEKDNMYKIVNALCGKYSNMERRSKTCNRSRIIKQK